MKGKIAITPRSLSSGSNPHFAVLEAAGYELIFPAPGRQPVVEEIKGFLPHCVGYLAGVEQIPAEALRSAKNLKVISRNGTGIDNIDLDVAEQLGIRVMRTPGANARGVAELTFALLLNCVRYIHASNRVIKNGGWQRTKGIELKDRTLGLIGCGAIGKLVAEIALGFGMNVMAYDLKPDTAFNPGNAFQFVSLDNLVCKADFISLHIPATSDKNPIITRKRLAEMKKGVFLINTARYGLIDDTAALEALESGKVAGLATDVFAEEPPQLNRLLHYERVITTPHIGGFTQESVDRATRYAVENLLKILESND